VSRTFKLLAVGVGGQGVLSTARILGSAGLAAGFEVRVGQLHGLAQRGGSVEATLHVGPGDSAFISRAEADVVLALEPLEAQRAIPRMSAQTIVIVNPAPIVPYTLTSKGKTGPRLESIVAEIRKATPHVMVVDASGAAREAGSPLALNVAMLGVLAGLDIVPIPPKAIASAVNQFGRVALREVNRRAFEEGRRLGMEAGAAAAPPEPKGSA